MAERENEITKRKYEENIAKQKETKKREAKEKKNYYNTLINEAQSAYNKKIKEV